LYNSNNTFSLFWGFCSKIQFWSTIILELNGRRHSDFALSAKYVVFYEKKTADTFNFLRMLGKIEQKDEKWAISDQFSATIVVFTIFKHHFLFCVKHNCTIFFQWILNTITQHNFLSKIVLCCMLLGGALIEIFWRSLAHAHTANPKISKMTPHAV
jgi:hypothetical protein